LERVLFGMATRKPFIHAVLDRLPKLSVAGPSPVSRSQKSPGNPGLFSLELAVVEVSASRQRDCEQEQRKRKHHYEVTRDPVAQTLIATQMGGVVLPLPLRKVPWQGSSMFAAVADSAVRHACTEVSSTSPKERFEGGRNA
jgi:hypothetical protein